MGRKHCIRAVIGRRSIRAPFLVGRAAAVLQHCFGAWRRVAANSAAIVFPVLPTTFSTVHFSSKGERRAPRFIESPNREAQTGTEDLRHILVVDDDPMVCMAIEVYL